LACIAEEERQEILRHLVPAVTSSTCWKDIGIPSRATNASPHSLSPFSRFGCNFPIVLLLLGIIYQQGSSDILRTNNTMAQNYDQTVATLLQDDIPEEYICPITQDFMKDPVIAEDGTKFLEPHC
jgi:hypothetical protein